MELINSYLADELFAGKLTTTIALLAFLSGLVAIIYAKSPFVRGVGLSMLAGGLLYAPSVLVAILRNAQNSELLYSAYAHSHNLTNETITQFFATQVADRQLSIWLFLPAIAGVLLLTVFPSSYRRGLATGLFVVCAFGLSVDRYAESRAVRYDQMIRVLAKAESSLN